MKHIYLALGLAGATFMGVTSSSYATDKVVKIDGSSTVFPVAEAVAEEFQIHKKGAVNVTVGVSGTGGGFKKFIRGEIDIANASRPISKEEMALAKQSGIEYIELPICFDALTVAVSPKNSWIESITISDLKKIWEPSAQGKITTWNQVNPNWPNEKIDLYGAGTDSGTFDYFTEAVVGEAKASRGDFTASEDDNVIVRGIGGNKNALGYLPFAYYSANKGQLKALKIDWEKDALGPVEPSQENVVGGIYNPLSRPMFIYVNKKSVQEKPWVKEFVEFLNTNVKELSQEVKYTPLPDEAYEAIRARFAELKSGTGFAGEAKIGMAVSDVLKVEPIS